MKSNITTGLFYPWLFIVIVAAGACTVTRYPSTADSLEHRLDTLLAGMSMQEKVEQLYYLTDGNSRLGIPQFKGSDGPHGIGNKAYGFSSFPVTIAMAATWDPDLITRVGRAISEEQAARGKDRIAGPTLDLLIDPRIGRAAETIGEDPFLGGRISAAFVQGQNTTAVFGSIKHYNLNTYEMNRRTNNYLSDQRSLVEFWGAHWKRTIQYGGALSVMCAYNWVNGDKCAENQYLLKNLLRNHWGFSYYTMSDWGGFKETGKALNAELDFCEGNDLYIKELPGGLHSGLFDSTLVNRAARNVLRTKIMSGMLDGSPAVSKTVIDNSKHRQLVYESGLKSLVLLKNAQQILPLNKNAASNIAVIGPNGAVLPLDGSSSSKVWPSYRITVEEGIKAIAGANHVQYVKGCNINDMDRSQFGAAIAAAKQASYVVFVGGLDSTVEGEGYFLDKDADEKGGGVLSQPDRSSQTVLMPGVQNELVNAIAQVNPNIILVVISGGICSVTPVIRNVKALLYAFYPGQEGGRAIADVLFGNYNPSGKLPATMPKNDEQIIPVSTDFRNMVTRGAGYRWFDAQQLQPEFAFGAGLSFTNFTYSDITVINKQARVGDLIEINCKLTNTGKFAGEETAQLYLSTGKIVPQLCMPQKQLRGFKKIYLQPGETALVNFTLSPEELYVYDTLTNAYLVPEGEYIVQAGGASDQLPLKAAFLLHSALTKPDLLVKNIRTMPVFPKPGDRVVFMASLINNGTGPLPRGSKVLLHFFVDGKEVAYYAAVSAGIPAGGMELVCAQGLHGINWTAKNGNFAISVVIETDHSNDLHRNNNLCAARLLLPGGKVIPAEITSIIE